MHDDMTGVDQVLTALTDAQRRAVEQRLAAERFLEQARAIEARLAAQMEQARAANEDLAVRRCASAFEKAGELERAAAEEAERCSAEANVAREALERANAACEETNRRLETARTADEAARSAAAAATERLRERRGAREQAEIELRAARERATGFDGSVPSLAAIEELRALEARSGFQTEAARRAAERRAADAARGATR